MDLTTTQRKSKVNPFLFSEQVKKILHARGLSKVFNYSDYEFFKRRAKSSFNPVMEIAQMFIQEHQAETDFKDYQF